MIKKRIKVFISYAHIDNVYFEILIDHLKQNLKNSINFTFDFWDDRQIQIGALWDNEIQNNLKKSDLAILLISNNFLASEYIKAKEFGQLISENKDTYIIPLLLAPCDFYDWDELSKRQFFMPKGEKYGKPTLKDFTFADLITFRQDGVIIPNPNIDRYIRDFSSEIEIALYKRFNNINEKQKANQNNEKLEFQITDNDEKLGHTTSDILKTVKSPYGTEGIVRRFINGSIFLITKKGKPLINHLHVITGSQFRITTSNIGMCYEMFSGTGSRLGFPISDIQNAWDYSFRNWTTKGYIQWFEGGCIYFTERYGARILFAGEIRNIYAKYEDQFKKSQNIEMTGGILGFPITNEEKIISKYGTEGLMQRFEFGYIIHFENMTFGVTQGFYDIYQSIGSWASELGFPTSDDQQIMSYISKNKGSIKYFENGCMIWDNKPNKGRFIYGDIFKTWKSQTKKFGFPLNIQYVNKKYSMQDFEGGVIKFNNETKQIELD